MTQKQKDESFKSWFLSTTLEHKRMLFDKAWEEGKLGVFKGMMDIVMEAPLSEGGLPSEWFEKYHTLPDEFKRPTSGEVR